MLVYAHTSSNASTDISESRSSKDLHSPPLDVPDESPNVWGALKGCHFFAWLKQQSMRATAGPSQGYFHNAATLACSSDETDEEYEWPA